MADKRSDLLLENVRRLQQCDETWDVSCRLGRFWITPRNEPFYRPYFIVVVVESSIAILRTQVVGNSPLPEQLFEELLNAMLHPSWGAGKPRRPKVVNLDDTDFASVLEPWLADLEVTSQFRLSLPAVKIARDSLEQGMNRRKPIPGLLSIPSITPPQVGHLFDLATDFYQAKPWYSLGDNESMEIRCPPDGDPRYAVVMGSGGEVFGLAIYDELDDLRSIFEPRLSPRQRMKRFTWLVLIFEDARAMSFDDLDDIERFGWSIPNEGAYPVFGRTTKNAEIGPPTKADLFWMETALAGILAYLPEHNYRSTKPVEKTLEINSVSVKAQLYLKVPAFDRAY